MGNADYEYCPHRVAIPPSKPLFKSLESSFKETLFPDDPFRQFKNQPLSRKFILGLQYFIPILEWAPRYTFEFFKADFIAGITIASLAVPQGISYANLANLPPILGLCKCPFFYNKLSLSNLYACLLKWVILLCSKKMQIPALSHHWCMPCWEAQEIWQWVLWLLHHF